MFVPFSRVAWPIALPVTAAAIEARVPTASAPASSAIASRLRPTTITQKTRKTPLPRSDGLKYR